MHLSDPSSEVPSSHCYWYVDVTTVFFQFINKFTVCRNWKMNALQCIIVSRRHYQIFQFEPFDHSPDVYIDTYWHKPLTAPNLCKCKNKLSKYLDANKSSENRIQNYFTLFQLWYFGERTDIYIRITIDYCQ